jgi:membrane carboxypeptidase/penicillin-binding protein
MALGTSEATPLQIASAYTAFANLGTRVTPIAINRITTGERRHDCRADDAKMKCCVRRGVRDDFVYEGRVNRGTASKVRARGLKGNACRQDRNVSRRMVRRLHAEPRLRGVGWF